MCGRVWPCNYGSECFGERGQKPCIPDADVVADDELVLVLDEGGQAWDLVAPTIDGCTRIPAGLRNEMTGTV